jgi:hypothetical protein
LIRGARELCWIAVGGELLDELLRQIRVGLDNENRLVVAAPLRRRLERADGCA